MQTPLEGPGTIGTERFRLGHRPALDGVRGIAVIAVLLFHGGAPIFRGGSIGVDIFFVLSGFLITALLLDEYVRYQSISRWNFYARRFLRLLPALILLVISYLIVAIFSSNTSRHVMDALLPLTYLTNWIRAVGIGFPDYMGHTWSLSIEEQFYLLWPLALVYLLRKDSSFRMALQACLFGALFALVLRTTLVMTGSGPARVYNGLDTRADTLLLGCALAIALSKGWVASQAVRQRFETALSYAVWLLILVIATGSKWDHPMMLGPGYSLVAVLSALAILFVIRSPRGGITRLLEFAPLNWVGRLSYGIYLWHYPLIRIVKPYTTSWLTVIAVAGTLTLIMASLSYYLVEKRFLRLKGRFVRAASTVDAQPDLTADRSRILAG